MKFRLVPALAIVNVPEPRLTEPAPASPTTVPLKPFRSSVPVAVSTALARIAVSLPAVSVPALTVIGPRKPELVPVRINRPLPALVKVWATPSSARLLPSVVSAVLFTVRVLLALLRVKLLFRSVSAVEPLIVRFAFNAMGFSIMRGPPVALIVEAALTVTVPVPTGPEVMIPPEETVSTPRVTVPAVREVPPEYVFTADNVKLPVPAFVRSKLPVMGADTTDVLAPVSKIRELPSVRLFACVPAIVKMPAVPESVTPAMVIGSVKVTV